MRAGPIEIFHNGTITRDSCIGTSYADAGRTDRDLSQWGDSCIGTRVLLLKLTVETQKKNTKIFLIIFLNVLKLF
jgi:hypothetical protein